MSENVEKVIGGFFDSHWRFPCINVLCCRFDCGSGAGRAHTDNVLLPGRWNVIHVQRHRRTGWIQLNNGPRSLTRSKVCTCVCVVQFGALLSSAFRLLCNLWFQATSHV